VGSGFLLIVLVLFGVMYFMSIRPQQQRAERRLEMIRSLRVGDEVITEGGIYGEVKSLDEERIRLEVDADVEIVVARQAITAKVPPEAENESLDESLAAHDDDLEQAEDELRTPEEEPAEEGRAAR
jgi:preprotein translocase subunit YajC